MSLLDRYHVFVHNVSAAFGYDYNDATPDWVHPFIHLILVLAPALLISVGLYLAIRGILKLWKDRSTPAIHPEPIRGLEGSLFSTVLRYSRRQQALMIVVSLIAMSLPI